MSKPRFSAHVHLLRIMAHPVRLRILRALTKGTKCVNDMCELLDAPQPNVSQHLAALKQSRLVAAEKRGVLRCYRLARPRLVKGLFALLDRETEAGKTSSPATNSRRRHPETLVCLKHNIEVDKNNPRCPQPSSQCRFRALCPVMDAAKALVKEPK